MKAKILWVSAVILCSGCVNIPMENDKCHLKCYGIEAIENKVCLGLFNFHKCYNGEDPPKNGTTMKSP